MGAGPEALLDAGLQRELRESGHRVYLKIAELPADGWHAEIQTSFELMRMLSAAVREAREANRLPIVLAGNCNTAVGTMAGLGTSRTGVVWFDAHADFNTPDTTTSGFLDGTAMSILTGRCWTQLASTIPDFKPVPEESVCLIGVRDVDREERRLLDASEIAVIEPDQIRSDLMRRLQTVSNRVDSLYVHMDLDVLDIGVAPANQFAVAGGLTLEDLEYALDKIADNSRLGGITLSAYDPHSDSGGEAARAALRLISTAARLAKAS